MKILNYKAVDKGALKAFFDLVIENWGEMTISCSLFESNGKKWINLPQKEYEKDGQKKYQSLVKFNKMTFDALQKKAIELIDKQEVTKVEPKKPTYEQTECPF